MHNLPSRCLLVATLSLGGAGFGHAETSPYYVGISAAVLHDSNVFRLPSAQATGDTSTSLGLLGGIDQPIGRQRIYASGVIRNNRFRQLTQLDNTSYGLNAGLDWATIEKLSGSLNFSGNSNLINYGGSNTTQTTTRNIEKSSQTTASVQYGMASLLSLVGSFTHRSLSYSDPVYRANDVTQDAGSVGVNYRPSAGLTFGAGLRMTRGDYRNTDTSFKRRDLDLTTTWIPSGLSTVSARLSYGRQTTDNVDKASEFSGATGYLSWLYQPTGKLQVTTWISRDTGTESGFFNFTSQQFTGIGDTSQFTNTLAVDAAYAATGKIRVTAGVRTSRRSLANGALRDNDTVNSASLGASYQALRNLQFSCSAGRETRSAGGVLSSDYRANTVNCSAQITLQ